MKKYLSVILWIILTACLVACGSSNKDSVNDDKQEVRLGKMNMPEREVVELLSNGDVELKISKEWNWCFSIRRARQILDNCDLWRICNFSNDIFDYQLIVNFKFVGMTWKIKFKEQSFTLFAYTNYRTIQGSHRLEPLDFKGKGAFHHFLVQ